jgi:hypothetical protein
LRFQNYACAAEYRGGIQPAVASHATFPSRRARALTYVNAATQFWFDLATKSMRFARKCARRKRRFAPTLRLRNLQDVACALAHLDRGADPALRAFKNGSRHDVADRIFAPSKPQLFTLRLEAEQQCAARCMLACGAGLFVRSVGKFQTAEQIACSGAERAFRSPQRFEAADSQCSVLDRSSLVPPRSIASNRSTFGGGEGWIKRSQDSAISSQVRFSDALRVKCAIRSHSAAFARYSSFLFMGRFRQWLSFAHQSPNVQVVPTTAIRFRRSRRRPRRTGKTDARRLAAVGNNLRSPGRGYFFIRLFLRPWTDCACWVCWATRGAARATRGARLSRSVA